MEPLCSTVNQDTIMTRDCENEEEKCQIVSHQHTDSQRSKHTQDTQDSGNYSADDIEPNRFTSIGSGPQKEKNHDLHFPNFG